MFGKIFSISLIEFIESDACKFTLVVTIGLLIDVTIFTEKSFAISSFYFNVTKVI